MAITYEQAKACLDKKSPVWYEDEKINLICRGLIQKISDDRQTLFVRGMTVCGFRSVKLKDTYETDDAAIEAQDKRLETHRNRTKTQIHTIEDLVRFAYQHNVGPADEYTDWIARTIYAEKAKELLGIDVTKNGEFAP